MKYKTMTMFAAFALGAALAQAEEPAKPLEVGKVIQGRGIAIQLTCLPPVYPMGFPDSIGGPDRMTPGGEPITDCTNAQGRTLVQVSMSKELFGAKIFGGRIGNGASETPEVATSEVHLESKFNTQTYWMTFLVFNRPANQVFNFRFFTIADYGVQIGQ